MCHDVRSCIVSGLQMTTLVNHLKVLVSLFFRIAYIDEFTKQSKTFLGRAQAVLSTDRSHKPTDVTFCWLGILLNSV